MKFFPGVNLRDIIGQLSGLQRLIREHVDKIYAPYHVSLYPVRILKPEFKKGPAHTQAELDKLGRFETLQRSAERLMRRAVGIQPPMVTGIPTISREEAIVELAGLRQQFKAITSQEPNIGPEPSIRSGLN